MTDRPYETLCVGAKSAGLWVLLSAGALLDKSARLGECGRALSYLTVAHPNGDKIASVPILGDLESAAMEVSRIVESRGYRLS